jgi:hypothetical protein
VALETVFEELISSRVDLDPAVTASARRKRDLVLGFMDTTRQRADCLNLLMQAFPPGLSGGSRKPQPLDDIDLYIVVDGRGLIMVDGNWDRFTAQRVIDSNLVLQLFFPAVEWAAPKEDQARVTAANKAHDGNLLPSRAR